MKLFFFRSKNSFIEVKIYKYSDVFNTLDKNITSNLQKIETNETNIVNLKGEIEKMHTILDKTYTISERSGNKIFEVNFDNNFTNKGILKIKANYDHNFLRIYNFYDNNDIFKVITLGNEIDEFEIDTVDSSRIKISIFLVDTTIELYDGTIQIKYYDTNDYKIDINANNITSNLEKINTIENNISSVIRKNTIFDKIYTIQNFSKSRNNYEIFKINLNNRFTDEGILKINAKYNYINNIGKYSNVYKFYNNNIEFKEIEIDHRENTINDEFEIDTIKSSSIRLSIFLINNDGDNSLITLHDYNTIQIKYLDNINTSKIEKNKTDISNNLKEINLIKENTSNNQYLKNIYNILFYNKKTQIDFRDDKYFYEKVFEDNYSINNFMEISFRISLETDSISLINYVKVIYQIFDENDNSLYIKSVNLNEYKYFSNKIFIDELIFYNINTDIKKIKFSIKFEKISNKIIFMYYLKNDNYRFILKHYGL